MKAFICLALLVALSASAEVETENFVHVLTNENFSQFIAQNEFVLVKFYAPWCGHCKSLAPEFASAAEDLKDSPYKLANLDATVHTEAASKFQIKGYPTLYFFINGKHITYNGGRKKDDIISWIFKKTQPTSTELQTVEEVENFKLTSDVVLVFMGHLGFDAFITKTKEIDDVVFGHCKTAECLSHYKVRNGSIVLFKNFDNGRNDLAPFFGINELKALIEKEGVPQVIVYSSKYEKTIFEGKQVYVFYLYNKSEPTADKYEKLARTLSPKLKAQFQVQTVLSDIESNDEAKLNEKLLDIRKDQLPFVLIADLKSKPKKYFFNEEINSENILRFAENWAKNRLQPEQKSEEIPKTQGPVTKIVGKTWKEIVYEKNKDVLVKYYAPWCGHCKSVAPIYEELAKLLTPINPNLVIAEIDVAANEFEFELASYPTFHIFPAATKKLEAFKGDRTVDGFIEFLEKHATHTINKTPKTDL